MGESLSSGTPDTRAFVLLKASSSRPCRLQVDMSNPEVFSRNGSKFPVYIQGDAFPAVYNSLKELVHVRLARLSVLVTFRELF